MWEQTNTTDESTTSESEQTGVACGVESSDQFMECDTCGGGINTDSLSYVRNKKTGLVWHRDCDEPTEVQVSDR